MSERQVKVRARDIRRAFGPEAVEALVIHETQIQKLRAELDAQGQRLAALTTGQAVLGDGLAAVTSEFVSISKELVYVNARRLRDRLHWLMRGMPRG